MILPDFKLREIFGDDPSIQPASIDVHLGDRLLRLPYGVTIDPERDQSALWEDVPLRDDGRWWLAQNTLYLGVTLETVPVPHDAVAFLHGLSSLGRLGLLVHVTAGLIDPGNELRPTLELVSLGGTILLRPGQRIGQVTFHTLVAPVERPYGGKYKGDQEPTPSRSYLDAPVKIPLRDRNGAVIAHAIVDAADFPFVNRWRWHLDRQTGYASRNTTRGTVRLHREILGLVRGDGTVCDHINRNKLDCRRVNLRVGTQALNRQNTPSRGGTSSFRGVSWDKKNRKWMAHVQVNGKQTNLGRYADEREAARVASEARARLMPWAVER
jgi:dCTP deaminase